MTNMKRTQSGCICMLGMCRRGTEEGTHRKTWVFRFVAVRFLLSSKYYQ